MNCFESSGSQGAGSSTAYEHIRIGPEVSYLQISLHVSQCMQLFAGRTFQTTEPFFSCSVWEKGSHLECGHSLQLKGVPQHDIAVQPATGNEAVSLAPVTAPHACRVALKILHRHPGLHISQTQPLVQGAGQHTVQLCHILQLADPVLVELLAPQLLQAPPASSCTCQVLCLSSDFACN